LPCNYQCLYSRICNMFRDVVCFCVICDTCFVVISVWMSIGISVSSMCYVLIPKSLSKKYISLLYYNSDDVVISHAIFPRMRSFATFAWMILPMRGCIMNVVVPRTGKTFSPTCWILPAYSSLPSAYSYTSHCNVPWVTLYRAKGLFEMSSISLSCILY